MTDVTETHSPAPGDKREPGGVQAVDRALLLLRLVGEEKGPVSLQTLCARSGLNRTTVWRLLTCLEKNHFLARNPVSKEYDFGYAVSHLCALSQRRNAPLIRLVLPEMEQLMEQFQESVLLSVPCPGGTITICQRDPQRSVRLKDYVNQVTPLWGTSTGKVLLAHFPPKQLESFLLQPLSAFTRDTITDPELLRREVIQVSRAGYATVEGEWSGEENGISAPILSCGEPVAVLGLGGPRARLTAQIMKQIAPVLCAACRRIEKLLA